MDSSEGSEQENEQSSQENLVDLLNSEQNQRIKEIETSTISKNEGLQEESKQEQNQPNEKLQQDAQNNDKETLDNLFQSKLSQLDDEEFQRKQSEQLNKQYEERNKLVQQLQQKLKPGEHAPKNSDYYNQFINKLADLVSKQKLIKEIEEFLDENLNEGQVKQVLEIISEINDKKQTSDRDNQILNSIKLQIPSFKEMLNDKQIFELIQEMKIHGYQSNLYQEYHQGDQLIDEQIFDIHITHPFMNEKTFKVCQQYFKIANFSLSEKESEIVLDMYYINIQKYLQNISQNLIKFQQIDEIISSNCAIKKYIEKYYSLSIKKIMLALFNQEQLKDKFLCKKLINKENSEQKLQKLVEKYKINKDDKDFNILEQIYSADNFISLYFKSLLLIEINQPKDDQELYFFKIFQLLQEVEKKGLEALSYDQNQKIIKLLKIDQNILNAKDFENLDYFDIQIFQLICTDNKNKINLIEFVIRKELSNLPFEDDQFSYLSKQIHSTGLTFIHQLNEQKKFYAKEIDQKLSKCKALNIIYGKNLYEVQDQNMKFYFDFENEMKVQSQRDQLFKISKCIDVNQLLEYHNSQENKTHIELWIKHIVDLYKSQDQFFANKLYDLIIYLSKRNQNLDFIFLKIQELLLKNESKLSRFLINKKVVFEYLFQYSDTEAQFKLILMLGFANPVPLLITKIIQNQDNQFKFQQKLSYESFWLLKNSDKAVASLGIGFQKGKSTLLNEVFATNFAISDGSYSFIGSADIQSNHIFQQNKRKYFVADFHGDAAQLDEQYILGFFVYYILQVNVKLIYGNEINELERIVQILENNNKKFCILIRDFEENKQKSKNDNMAFQQFKIPLLENKYTLILPNLKIINEEEKNYHLNQTRQILDNLINEQSENQSSQTLFIQRFFTQECSENEKQISLTYQQVNQICDNLEENQDLQIKELFYVYSIFSKYQKKKMELTDWRFNISNDKEILERGQQFEQYENEYNSLNIKEDSQRSKGATLFEKIIYNPQNFYQKMLFFIQRLKDVNFKKIGNLKEKKRDLFADFFKKNPTNLLLISYY